MDSFSSLNTKGGESHLYPAAVGAIWELLLLLRQRERRGERGKRRSPLSPPSPSLRGARATLMAKCARLGRTAGYSLEGLTFDPRSLSLLSSPLSSSIPALFFSLSLCEGRQRPNGEKVAVSEEIFSPLTSSSVPSVPRALPGDGVKLSKSPAAED